MKKKRKSLIEAERSMEKLLLRVGYTGKYKGVAVNDIPRYKAQSNLPKTSDTIPSKTPKKTDQVYTGNEIAGIVVTHKSNLVPIRKDNKQAAIDAAQMRRN
jgi:hypothetical protein